MFDYHLPTFYNSYPELDPELCVAWGMCTCGWHSGIYTDPKFVAVGWNNHLKRENGSRRSTETPSN